MKKWKKALIGVIIAGAMTLSGCGDSELETTELSEVVIAVGVESGSSSASGNENGAVEEETSTDNNQTEEAESKAASSEEVPAQVTQEAEDAGSETVNAVSSENEGPLELTREAADKVRGIQGGDSEPLTAETVNTDTQSEKGTIVLDPGHSSIVSGELEPIGPGADEMKPKDASGTHGEASQTTEYELTLQVCQKLRTELQNRGYIVYMTREDNDTEISCSERAKAANNAGADVFLRIHANGSENAGARGAMAICITQNNPYQNTYAESRRLSDEVLTAYCEATGIANTNVLEEDNMSGNNWSEVPTTLIELGFMTNPEEDLLMASEECQANMVQGLANGIDRYMAGRSQ
ncbi:MAG: N-acetylmuramoyl-L-alanine amidase [Eubacteriales bacterium]|nr:N-acetylmuramoyl-L-alanine amidase [Eubacteriales bacterium]